MQHLADSTAPYSGLTCESQYPRVRALCPGDRGNLSGSGLLQHFACSNVFCFWIMPWSRSTEEELAFVWRSSDGECILYRSILSVGLLEWPWDFSGPKYYYTFTISLSSQLFLTSTLPSKSITSVGHTGGPSSGHVMPHSLQVAKLGRSGVISDFQQDLSTRPPGQHHELVVQDVQAICVRLHSQSCRALALAAHHNLSCISPSSGDLLTSVFRPAVMIDVAGHSYPGWLRRRPGHRTDTDTSPALIPRMTSF